MGELTATQRTVLAAVAREEITLTRWPVWHRGARWAGHKAPSLTVLALHRRGLVEAMPPAGGGPCRAWVQLTADGREALGEVAVDA